ncbi:universal stress protein [Haloarcula litorea]|uniref:universal stress protein n=1 Tax=Haloarcula litorea TaxID=3032579 RepID=UPI0023E8587D|nr:universal stress protein [Halomicroarcula sp. GDY20]
MFDTLLVPTDGSGVADAAVDAGIALADRFDAELHVVHALEPSELPPGVEDEAAGALAHRGETAVTDAIDRAREAGVDATGTVLEATGATHDLLVAYATEHGVDCIVMGTYGRTGLDRFVLGSVAERTLRTAPMPVLTVHEGTELRLPFESVLVATDGSDCSAVAADRGADLAAAMDATLHVVHVVDATVPPGDLAPGTVLDELETAGERAIQSAVDRAPDAVSTVEASVLRGVPYRAILDYAEEHAVDCLVLGTHGRSGLERYVLGSVAERVVRLSDTPVLTVTDDRPG